MSKFLRMIESNLPTEGQDEYKIDAHHVLMNIRTSLQELDSKFTIGTSMPENSPQDGDVIRSAIMNINGIPRFKITVTPIEAKAPIKSEEAEDDDVIRSGIKSSTKYGPAAVGAANKVAIAATRRFNDAEKELNSKKPKANII